METKQSLFEKLDEVLKNEKEFPSGGLMYIQLRDGSEFYIEGYIFGTMQASEMSMFILAIGHYCTRILSISPIYKHSIFNRHPRKDTIVDSKINRYFSYMEMDFTNFPVEKLNSNSFTKKLTISDIYIKEECYFYNKKNLTYTEAPAFSTVATKVIENEIEQRIKFLDHCSSFKKKFNNGYFGDLDNPFGGIPLAPGENSDDIIREYYDQHYDGLYKSIDKLFTHLRQEMKSHQDMELDDDPSDLKNILKNNNKDDIENESNNNAKDELDAKGNRRNSKSSDDAGSSTAPKSSGGKSFLSGIKRKFGKE